MRDPLGPTISSNVTVTARPRSAPCPRARGHRMEPGLGGRQAGQRGLRQAPGRPPGRRYLLNAGDYCGGAAARKMSVFRLSDFRLSFRERGGR